MKGAGYILILMCYCKAAQEVDIWMSWAAKIKIKGATEFCNGVLVTDSNVLTTCDCATNSDFIFPEFLRKTATHYIIEIRENDKGYQKRNVLTFDVHPKCTSSYFVQGFLTFNFAFARTALPFQRTKYVHPIERRLLNSFGAMQSISECALMGHNSRLSITPFPIKLESKENCSERASLALGTETINFEEKGMLCVDVDSKMTCNTTSGICDETDSQSVENSSKNVQNVCDWVIVSGAPVICNGALSGLVSHGLCQLNSAPVIISRIELTKNLVVELSFGAKPVESQIIPTMFAAVLIVKYLTN